MIKHCVMALSLAMAGTTALAQEMGTYRVTITNLTPGQTFTPQLVATHAPSFRLLTLGQPASEALAILAEGGDTGPLAAAIEPVASEVVTIAGLLGPGQSALVEISGTPGRDAITVASMLIPTNDTFIALTQGTRLPLRGSIALLLEAYDAGSEGNDQNCASIPGPRCGGEGVSPGANDGDEGFVHVSNGFHEMESPDVDGNEVLGPRRYDWRNPVAKVSIRRIN